MFLAALQPRTLLILIVLTFLVTLLGAYVYLLNRDVLEIAHLRDEKHQILGEFEREKTQTGDAQIRRLRSEIAKLDAAVYGQGGQMSPTQLVSYVIRKLDDLSARHDIQLMSIQPEARTHVRLFEETPFAVAVKGSYFRLYAWLQDVERALSPMVVKQFRITPRDGEDTPLTMTLRIVSYRLLEDEA